MKLGNKVTWRAYGRQVTGHRGEIVAVIEPGESPVRQACDLFDADRCRQPPDFGMPRPRESYLVLVGRTLYWPRVSALTLERKP